MPAPESLLGSALLIANEEELVTVFKPPVPRARQWEVMFRGGLYVNEIVTAERGGVKAIKYLRRLSRTAEEEDVIFMSQAQEQIPQIGYEIYKGSLHNLPHEKIEALLDKIH